MIEDRSPGSQLLARRAQFSVCVHAEMSSDDGSSEAGTPKGGDVTNERDLNGVKVAQQQPDDVGVPPSGQDQPGGGGGDDDDMLETSFFPSPAHYYKRYTSSNFALPLDSVIGGIGVDEVVTRAELEPPNVDWIVEGGSYSVFGDTWPVEEVLPTLEEQGVREMFTRGQGELLPGLTVRDT